MTLAWLAAAIGAFTGAYLVGAPAWRSSRDRAERDTNTERYLAWRGRARERPAASEGRTPDERRRLVLAGVLAVVGVVALIGFFVAT